MKSTMQEPISVRELQEPEIAIAAYIQTSEYNETLNSLKKCGTLKRSDKLYKLNPFVGEDVLLRMKGRSRWSSVPSNSKYPKILPIKNHAVGLLIRHTHETKGHMGHEVIISELRKDFWIVGLTNHIRRLMHNCVTCRKLNVRPCHQPVAPLPVDRVTGDNPAFTNTG